MMAERNVAMPEEGGLTKAFPSVEAAAVAPHWVEGVQFQSPAEIRVQAEQGAGDSGEVSPQRHHRRRRGPRQKPPPEDRRQRRKLFRRRLALTRRPDRPLRDPPYSSRRRRPPHRHDHPPSPVSADRRPCG